MNVKKAGRRLGKMVSRPSPDQYSEYLNTTIKFIGNDWFFNERIVEIPIALRHVGSGEVTASERRVLEFGCTRSDLALQLASYGYHVVGIDLRPYPFTHPNLQFWQENVLTCENEAGFDYITAVSVIEHIGLGAYGETPDQSHRQAIMDKLGQLLIPGGRIIVAIPFGQPSEDHFLRSFSHEEILLLLPEAKFRLRYENYFQRTYFKSWRPCLRQEMESVSDTAEDRGPTGANGVGCFVWQKR